MKRERDRQSNNKKIEEDVKDILFNPCSLIDVQKVFDNIDE